MSPSQPLHPLPSDCQDPLQNMDVDQINDLLLWASVFMLKNEKSLLSYIILLYETILRGPGKFRVPASKNIIMMNLVIKPSRSQKAHPNWVTEKRLTMDST